LSISASLTSCGGRGTRAGQTPESRDWLSRAGSSSRKRRDSTAPSARTSSEEDALQWIVKNIGIEDLQISSRVPGIEQHRARSRSVFRSSCSLPLESAVRAEVHYFISEDEMIFCWSEVAFEERKLA